MFPMVKVAHPDKVWVQTYHWAKLLIKINWMKIKEKELEVPSARPPGSTNA